MQNVSVWRTRRRGTLFKASLLGSALALIACAKPHHPPQNVLLLTLDTFRADRIGKGSPALLHLARAGVRFEAADSPVPLTLPAHASLLSGLLPLHHGLRNNGTGAFPGNRTTLPQLFAAAGYRTGAFVGSFILDHRFGLNRGFQHYDDEISRNPDDASGTFEAERRADEVVNRALSWLRQRDPRPSFTWVHLYDAHAPYAPPPPFPQTYDGEVAFVDAQVARLLAQVDRNDTIVVVTGDHGEALGAHGELTHGLLLYEPTLHVPMIIAAPSLHPRVVHMAVSTIDLAPTVAALAGLQFPGVVDGRDLDLQSGREPEPAPLFAETQYPTMLGWSALSAVRLGNAKLIAGRYAELFDLARDGAETTNLAGGSRRLVRDLSVRLEAIGKTMIAPQAISVDAETRRKLASLGYVAPASSPAVADRRDPRAMASVFRRYEEALSSIRRGHPAAAAKDLDALVADDPANALFRQTLGEALRQKGDVAAAVVRYREAVALAPSSADAWYNLASALQEAGQLPEATTAIDEAARLEPNRIETRNVRGTLEARSGHLIAAEADFRALLVIDPRNARAWGNLGNVLRATGRDAEAEQAYRTAIAIAPRSADALNGLGVVLVQRGQTAAAIRMFDQALAVTPDLYEAQLNRAVARQLGGDATGAAADLHDLLHRMPADPAWNRQRDAARQFLKRVDPRAPSS